ncbi:innexin inx4-like [Culicoides brevitarsis]|uniref:innexin inx4-like n=1 Tax=Culicoides brevitarsis TaxID=469753 RepID=UPI00307B66A2
MNYFRPVKLYSKSKNYDTSNWAFKLLCRVNVKIMLLFVLLMMGKEYFGDPIDCGSEIGGVRKDSIEKYCWTMGLYVQKGFTGVITNRTRHAGYITGVQGERTYLRYYQWLILVYLTMAATFLLPGQLWRYFEGDRIGSLCKELDGALFERVWTKERRSEMLAYFMWPGVRSIHTLYVFKFYLCQIFLLGVTIFNIWLVDTTLGGFWDRYYPAISYLYPFDYENFIEHSAKIFPRMARCEFYNYGPSGSGQKMDALCLLPLNILNEKIFVFLYFWLLLMCLVAAFSVVWSTTIACFSCLRVLILKAQCRECSLDQIRRATNNGRLGDFFVLHLLGKNMNAFVFKDILMELSNYQKTGFTFEQAACNGEKEGKSELP